MWLTVITAMKKYLAPLGVLLFIVLSVLGYGQVKRREGKQAQVNKDRKTIDEMVERKEERRVITQPIAIERRRERVRRQRDELTKGVLRP